MTTKEKKITPLPWEIINTNISSCASDGVSDICYMNECLDWEANAQFIVTACNAYPQMLIDQEIRGTILIKQGEVIKEMTDIIKTVLGQIEEGISFPCTEDNRKLLEQVLLKVNAN